MQRWCFPPCRPGPPGRDNRLGDVGEQVCRQAEGADALQPVQPGQKALHADRSRVSLQVGEGTPLAGDDRLVVVGHDLLQPD